MKKYIQSICDYPDTLLQKSVHPVDEIRFFHLTGIYVNSSTIVIPSISIDDTLLRTSVIHVSKKFLYLELSFYQPFIQKDLI